MLNFCKLTRSNDACQVLLSVGEINLSQESHLQSVHVQPGFAEVQGFTPARLGGVGGWRRPMTIELGYTAALALAFVLGLDVREIVKVACALISLAINPICYQLGLYIARRKLISLAKRGGIGLWKRPLTLVGGISREATRTRCLFMFGPKIAGRLRELS